MINIHKDVVDNLLPGAQVSAFAAGASNIRSLTSWRTVPCTWKEVLATGSMD